MHKTTISYYPLCSCFVFVPLKGSNVFSFPPHMKNNSRGVFESPLKPCRVVKKWSKRQRCREEKLVFPVCPRLYKITLFHGVTLLPSVCCHEAHREFIIGVTSQCHNACFSLAHCSQSAQRDLFDLVSADNEPQNSKIRFVPRGKWHEDNFMHITYAIQSNILYIHLLC